MNNNYEMMYILRPDLSEEQVEQAITKYRDFLADYEGEDIQIQNRGKRRLAYEIKKHLDGIYIQMNYKANGKHVAPLERAMRLSEEVIRYLTLIVKVPKSTSEVSDSVEVEAETS